MESKAVPTGTLLCLTCFDEIVSCVKCGKKFEENEKVWCDDLRGKADTRHYCMSCHDLMEEEKGGPKC